MFAQRILRVCFFCLSMVLCGASASLWARDPLDYADVSRIVTNVLEERGETQVTTDLYHKALLSYIDQFDPQRMYLLAHEVFLWQQLDELSLLRAVSQFEKQQFPLFESLHQTCVKALLRHQKLREEVLSDPKGLSFLETSASFASNHDTVRQKIRNEFLAFWQLHGQQRPFTQVLDQYVRLKTQHERLFIPQHLDGTKYSSQEQESRVSMLILKSFLKSFDQYTKMLSSQDRFDLQLSLDKTFFGVGLVFQESLDGYVVERIFSPSPSSRQGQIQIGDRLVSLNGQRAEELTLAQVHDTLRSPQGPQVELTLERLDASSYQVYLAKEHITLDHERVTTTSIPFAHGILGAIKLYSFYDNREGISAEKDVQEAIEALEKQGPLLGLVLDLRDNRGGYLHQAVRVAGLFLTNGVVVMARSNAQQGQEATEKIYRDLDGRTAFDGPLLVLVSHQTASAAEIVAQSLQDFGVALVVGDESTYGKGTIQNLNQDDRAYKVTVGQYYTVSGRSPENQGVHSDVVLPTEKSLPEHTERLDLVSSDQVIESRYFDTLEDLPRQVQPWYVRYYLPTLQEKQEVFKPHVPQLVRNSQKRIAQDKNYQFYLHKQMPAELEERSEEELLVAKGGRNHGVEDLQLRESFEILKDLIFLMKKSNSTSN